MKVRAAGAIVEEAACLRARLDGEVGRTHYRDSRRRPKEVVSFRVGLDREPTAGDGVDELRWAADEPMSLLTWELEPGSPRGRARPPVRRVALLSAALVLAGTGAGARPECAYACTCGPLEPTRALAAADAAVVASVVERREEGGRAILVLVVERRLKGPVGDRLEVATGLDSAGCGVAAEPGRRVGLFLQREGEAWQANLCGQVEPAALAAFPTAAGGEEVADSFAEATAWVLAIVAVAAVGVFLLRRRFRPD